MNTELVPDYLIDCDYTVSSCQLLERGVGIHLLCMAQPKDDGLIFEV